MRNHIAYCGLDCETCGAYLATIHLKGLSGAEPLI